MMIMGFVGCLFRLNGASPGNIRVVQEDTVLMGYHIPANVRFVFFCSYM